jgi:hypothetical protein
MAIESSPRGVFTALMPYCPQRCRRTNAGIISEVAETAPAMTSCSTSKLSPSYSRRSERAWITHDSHRHVPSCHITPTAAPEESLSIGCRSSIADHPAIPKRSVSQSLDGVAAPDPTGLTAQAKRPCQRRAAHLKVKQRAQRKAPAHCRDMVAGKLFNIAQRSRLNCQGSLQPLVPGDCHVGRDRA